MLRVHLKATPPNDYRTSFSSERETRALGSMLDHLFGEGFIMINTCSAAMSTAMGESEVDALVDAMAGGLRRAKPLL